MFKINNYMFSQNFLSARIAQRNSFDQDIFWLTSNADIKVFQRILYTHHILLEQQLLFATTHIHRPYYHIIHSSNITTSKGPIMESMTPQLLWLKHHMLKDWLIIRYFLPSTRLLLPFYMVVINNLDQAISLSRVLSHLWTIFQPIIKETSQSTIIMPVGWVNENPLHKQQ